MGSGRMSSERSGSPVSADEGISTGLPHAGHLTSLPADSTLALSLFPQLQTTEIMASTRRRITFSGIGPKTIPLVLLAPTGGRKAQANDRAELLSSQRHELEGPEVRRFRPPHGPPSGANRMGASCRSSRSSDGPRIAPRHH